MGNRQPTVQTVAKAAGVSVKSGSRGINKEKNVTQKTRDKVQKAIEQLNFRPTRAARQLRGAKNFNIAIIYEPPGTEFLNGVLEGVLPVCDREDYHVLLEPMPKASKRKYTDRLIARRHVDGAILLPPESENLELIEALQSADMKCILVESSVEGVSKIGIDNEKGGKEIGEYLIELGHLRFGFISLSEDRVSGNRRLSGFQKALQNANIPLENLVVKSGDCSFESGYDCARELLSKKQRPTAIFAGNDSMAIGAIACARDMGINVPLELSVSGFDNTEISRIFSPNLTTVTEPLSEFGRLAAEMLLESIRDKTAPIRHEVLDFEVIKRKSTQPFS